MYGPILFRYDANFPKLKKNQLKMRKSVLVVMLLAGLIALSFRSLEKKYTNLQVLPKDITEKQLDSVMHHFNASLGVKCGFCHLRKENKEWDHASDGNKHKLIARDMLKMTYEINDQHFNYTGAKRDMNTQLMVSCFTCHNGKKMPETMAPDPEDEKKKSEKEEKKN